MQNSAEFELLCMLCTAPQTFSVSLIFGFVPWAEIYNLSRLEVMLAREEEVKRKAMTEKALYGGPQIKFRSKDGTPS